MSLFFLQFEDNWVSKIKTLLVCFMLFWIMPWQRVTRGTKGLFQFIIKGSASRSLEAETEAETMKKQLTGLFQPHVQLPYRTQGYLLGDDNTLSHHSVINKMAPQTCLQANPWSSSSKKAPFSHLTTVCVKETKINQHKDNTYQKRMSDILIN